MPAPQTYTTWLLTCDSREAREELERWLSAHIDLARVVTAAVHTFPNGVEEVRQTPHRLGDYFAAIRILGASGQEPAAFRLVFQRHSGAGRYWKDVMVNILQEIATAPYKARVTLDYKGDEEPLEVSATTD